MFQMVNELAERRSKGLPEIKLPQFVRPSSGQKILPWLRASGADPNVRQCDWAEC